MCVYISSTQKVIYLIIYMRVHVLLSLYTVEILLQSQVL